MSSVTSNVTGNVTGNVTSNVTGNAISYANDSAKNHATNYITMVVVSSRLGLGKTMVEQLFLRSKGFSLEVSVRTSTVYTTLAARRSVTYRLQR